MKAMERSWPGEEIQLGTEDDDGWVEVWARSSRVAGEIFLRIANGYKTRLLVKLSDTCLPEQCSTEWPVVLWLPSTTSGYTLWMSLRVHWCAIIHHSGNGVSCSCHPIVGIHACPP